MVAVAGDHPQSALQPLLSIALLVADLDLAEADPEPGLVHEPAPRVAQPHREAIQVGQLARPNLDPRHSEDCIRTRSDPGELRLDLMSLGVPTDRHLDAGDAGGADD